METGFWIKLAITILLPALIALIVCSIWKSKMKTATSAREADSYIPSGGFNLARKEDTFLYRTQSRRQIKSNVVSDSGNAEKGSKISSGRGK